MKLLTIGDAKTSKGESLGVLTGILYVDNSFKTAFFCPYASEACKELCLRNSGRAEIFPAVNEARLRKAKAFVSDKTAFIEQLKKDIRELSRLARRRGMKAAVRLNGTSDILWERLIDFSEFPEVQFYDYTKVPLKYRKLAPNYHLTFSFSGNNYHDVALALKQGFNVAFVFAKYIPQKFYGFDVVDGTEHDVRFLDGMQGKIIGLLPKGSRAKLAAKNGSDFIVAQ